jgi:hypothetical protein
MLRFFRTIHRKLIKQNNCPKYSLYAIGKIVLPVPTHLPVYDRASEHPGRYRITLKSANNILKL